MNVGLIGCGGAAEIHTTVYKYMKNVKVVAVSDVVLDRAKILANKYGVDKIFNNYKDIFEVKDLDFVDICTPTSTHAQIACDTARSGHNIFLEKPMARTTAECESIIFECKKHNVKLCVGHNRRFLPSIRQAKSMIDSGHYDILSFRTSFKYTPHWSPHWTKTPQEGGILWEAGCHLVYLQLYFLQNIKQVYAIGSKLHYPVYDNFVALMRTPNQSYGIIEFSYFSKEPEELCEINTLDGKRLQIDLEYEAIVDKSRKIGREKSLVGEIHAGYNETKELLGKRMKFLLAFLNQRELFSIRSHTYLINSYLESLQQDSPTPVPPEEGKNTIRLLECIQESLSKDRTISVE